MMLTKPKSNSDTLFWLGAGTTVLGLAIAGPGDELALAAMTGGLSTLVSPIQGALGIGVGGSLGLIGLGLMVASTQVNS